jgi:tetratricopeptide (TPR) repeat protein
VRRWALLLVLVASTARASKPGSSEHAYRMINEWRIDEADKEIEALVRTRAHDADVLFLDGYLRFLHGDYDKGMEKLREAIARDPRPGELGDEMRGLRDLAQATAETTRGFVETRGTHFIIRHAPGKDALLVPYALAALERAYAAIGDDFAERPTTPVRVEIYPDVADLAKVSTLTLQEIETSGTIALCKFNRLMIVSPRALLAGYPWLDTLAHEYTHFIISRSSHNSVPIWLHEGLAKFEERRWRAGPGGGLTPTMEHLLASALARRHLITFEQMHPSMAKLPSQEDTALAFAEVYMAIEYLHGQIGWDGVRQIVARLRDGRSVPDAVGSVLGKSFEQFQEEWRAWLHGQHLRQRPGLIPTSLRFKKAPGKGSEASEDDASQISEDKARKLARLGGMLRARHRLPAAAIEYEKAQALVGPGNLQVANKLARTYLEMGDPERAIKTAEPALELYPDQAAPSATLGEAWLQRGDPKKAEPYLEGALAVSPFDPLVHCGLAKIYRQRGDGRAAREESACSALRGP